MVLVGWVGAAAMVLGWVRLGYVVGLGWVGVR